jgi:hypothetical protein
VFWFWNGVDHAINGSVNNNFVVVQLYGTFICPDNVVKKEFFVDNIIKGNLLPFIQTTFPDSHRFQQDNDPKHKSKLAQEFMTRNLQLLLLSAQLVWRRGFPSMLVCAEVRSMTVHGCPSRFHVHL